MKDEMDDNSTQGPTVSKVGRKLGCKVLCPVVIVAVTALCLGYDAGVMSAAIAPIQEEVNLTVTQEGLVMGCINLVAAPGALIGSKAADWRGRVVSVGGTAFLLLVGPTLVALSHGFYVLLLGRLVTGIGVGFAFVVAPLYAAEVSPPSIRAGVVAVTEILINAGVVLGYLSSMLLELPGIPPSVGWRIVTGMAAVPAMLTLVSIRCLPESPRWLMQKQRRAEALVVLQQLCADENEVEEAIQTIEEALDTNMQESGWNVILCPTAVVRRMLLAGVGCAFFQQASGSEVIVYYTPRILEEFGATSTASRNEGAILMGLAKLCGACVAGVFLDCIGRRAGVIASCLGVAACLLCIALLEVKAPAIGVLLLCLFMFLFELGLATAAFVLGTESYPVAIRAKALSLGMFVTRFLSGAIAVGFPVVIELVSLRSCIAAFSCMGWLGLFWAFFCVPETRGLSLEQAVQLFEHPILRIRHGQTAGSSKSKGKSSNQSADCEELPLKPTIIGRQ